MSTRKTNDKTSGRVMGEQRSNDINEVDQNRMAVAVGRLQVSSPAIHKLHAVATEEFFDYLSLKELHSIGLTCKRLNRLAGLYFQQNFRGIGIRFINNDTRVSVMNTKMDLIGFSALFESIEFNINSLDNIRYIHSNCTTIKEFRFYGPFKVSKTELEPLKDTLNKLESIYTIWYCNNYESLLMQCTNLKRLQIRVDDFQRDLLRFKFPKLEYIALPFYTRHFSEWKQFFKQNPSIRSMEITVRTLMYFALEMAKHVQLDELAIHDYIIGNERSRLIYKIPWENNVETIRALLVELHSLGFYKRLKISVPKLCKKLADLITDSPAVEKISFHSIDENIVWRKLPNLKVVEHRGFPDKLPLSSTQIVQNAINLESVTLIRNNFNEIQFLISHSKSLKEIRIVYDSMNFSDNSENIESLDIQTLDKTRERLMGARKVIIYLMGNFYLATKWAFGNQEFHFIEIRRFESSAWTDIQEYS